MKEVLCVVWRQRCRGDGEGVPDQGDYYCRPPIRIAQRRGNVQLVVAGRFFDGSAALSAGVIPLPYYCNGDKVAHYADHGKDGHDRYPVRLSSAQLCDQRYGNGHTDGAAQRAC